MMKRLALGFCTIAIAGFAFAANPASDNATDTVYNDGWTTGDNGGTGFAAWTLGNNATGSSGFFIGSSANNGTSPSGNIDVSGESFGIFANTGAVATANRSFTGGSMLAGQTFTLQLDNGFIDGGASVGFNLLNASGTDRFTFQFIGGQASYVYNIGDGNNQSTSIGFTDGGLTVAFTLGNNNAFSLSVTPNGGSTSIFNGTLAASDITQVQLFNSNAGSGSSHDAFFNNLALTAVPEPSALSLLAGPAILGAFFYLRRRRA
jgi:hypothetical protein